MFPNGFDRPDADSPFLSFVRDEFRRRGTEHRARLARKDQAYEVVAGLDIRFPAKIYELSDVESIAQLELPDRFVLKYAYGWSARGVMLLERVDRKTFFDHLSLRLMSPPEIINRQKKVLAGFPGGKKGWLLEEWVEPVTPGAIPFDYKFYCFRDRVGLVVQIDRNTSPPKVALFDGAFMPLREDTDFVFGSPNFRGGQHLLPLHAFEMLRCATLLSTQTDAPFVSIDLYDSPSGPVFGEFTFSPGATHRRAFAFSHSMLDRFDGLFKQESYGTANPEIDLARLMEDLQAEESILRQFGNLNVALYKKLSTYVYNDGRRGAVRFIEHYRERLKHQPGERRSRMLRHLVRAWEAIGNEFAVAGSRRAA